MKSALLTACIGLASTFSLAYADEGSSSLSLTSGFPSDIIGIEAGYDLTDDMGLRAGLGGIKLKDVKIGSVKGTIDTFGGFGFADYYPMGGMFRISAGAHFGNMDLALSDGTNDGKLVYQDFRPNVSIGFSTRDSMFVWFGDVGLSYVGKPDLSISNLDAETQAKARDSVDKRYLPMLRTGIGFRF